ncbi:MAG: phage baseplate assembly protein V [Aeromonas sp.]
MIERLEALERRIDQMVVRGTIEEVDCASHRVRVRYGPDSVTDWLEWKPVRSGLVTIWSPPQKGEGCTIISDGDLNRGEVLLGSYHNAMPSPSSDPDETVIVWADGSVLRYNMGSHVMTLEVVGDVNVKVEGNVAATVGKNMTANIKGNATVDCGGTIKADASKIHLNGGAGVVTGAHICQISGKPHADCSSTVTAGK